MFSAQGFVHRILIAQSDWVENPDVDLTVAGQQRQTALRDQLEPFHQRIEHLISQPLRTRPDRPFELDRATLTLTQAAADQVQRYYNANKNRAREDLQHWAGFAERLLEHLLRIAGTVAAFEQATQIGADHVRAAEDLMDFFVEQRRNIELGVTSRDQQRVLSVNRLVQWIEEKAWSGTRAQLSKHVRWFRDMSETEKDQMLEDAVVSGRLQVEIQTSTTHPDVHRYSVPRDVA
jgi:hypothetical protein